MTEGLSAEYVAPTLLPIEVIIQTLGEGIIGVPFDEMAIRIIDALEAAGGYLDAVGTRIDGTGAQRG